MKEGIQTNFPNPQIQQYGCYFLDLLRWGEILSGKQFNEENVLNMFFNYKSNGWIEDDCFVINPVAILNDAAGTVKGYGDFKNVAKSSKPAEGICIAYLKKSQGASSGHFVLYEAAQKSWDSLDPGRPAAQVYFVDSYRIIT